MKLPAHKGLHHRTALPAGL